MSTLITGIGPAGTEVPLRCDAGGILLASSGGTPPATEATLQEIRDGINSDPYRGLKYYSDETIGSTTYLLKAAGARWLLSKILANATGNVATYATVINNPVITTPAAAWTARASLVYGELSAA